MWVGFSRKPLGYGTGLIKAGKFAHPNIIALEKHVDKQQKTCYAIYNAYPTKSLTPKGADER